MGSIIAPEVKLDVIGIAVESIGTTIEFDRAKSEQRKPRHLCFRSLTQSIVDELPKELIFDHLQVPEDKRWAKHFSECYNGLKHYDRKLRNMETHTKEIHIFSLEAQMLLRLWVAHKLGCPTPKLKNAIQTSAISAEAGYYKDHHALFKV